MQTFSEMFANIVKKKYSGNFLFKSLESSNKSFFFFPVVYSVMQ